MTMIGKETASSDCDEAVCRQFFEAAAAVLGINLAFRFQELVPPARRADRVCSAAALFADEMRIWAAALERGGLSATLIEAFIAMAQRHMDREIALLAVPTLSKH